MTESTPAPRAAKSERPMTAEEHRQLPLMQRILPHPALTVGLIIAWMLFLNAFSLSGLILAVILGVLIPLPTSRFWPNRPDVRFGKDMAIYGWILFVDIIIANFRVAWIVLTRPNHKLRSAWFAVPLALKSPESVDILAGTVSLTAGTVSADISSDGRYLLIHALDVADVDAEIAFIKSRYEAQLLKVFR